jgi:hypothetical protein
MTTYEFTCKNGLPVLISLREDLTVWVHTPNHQEIGHLELTEYDDGGLTLTWAYLDKLDSDYLRQGIGRKCLQLIKGYYGQPVYAREDDGLRKDDGSHLTGDAPAWVKTMREEGLIAYMDRPDPLDDL